MINNIDYFNNYSTASFFVLFNSNTIESAFIEACSSSRFDINEAIYCLGKLGITGINAKGKHSENQSIENQETFYYNFSWWIRDQEMDPKDYDFDDLVLLYEMAHIEHDSEKLTDKDKMGVETLIYFDRYFNVYELRSKLNNRNSYQDFMEELGSQIKRIKEEQA